MNSNLLINKRLITIIGLLIIIVSSISKTKAQTKQIWIDGTVTYKINEKWSLPTEIGARPTIDVPPDSRQTTYYIRSLPTYHINKHLTAFTGPAWFYTVNPGEENTNEIRITQGIRNDNHFLKGRFGLSEMFRLEERCFINQPFQLRGRLQLQGTIAINKPKLEPRAAYIVGIVEAFDNFVGPNSNVPINSMRYTAGGGYFINESYRFEVSANRQSNRTEPHTPFEPKTDFLRIRLFYNIPYHHQN